MADFVTNIGEEWYTEANVDGATVTVGLFNQSTDSLTDTSVLGDITTEPAGSNYARQSSLVTTRQISNNFGFDNDSDLIFDVGDSSQDVDHAFYVVNFQSDSVAADGSATDHLVAVASLEQLRDLSGLSQLKIVAGSLSLVSD